jgi:hypothetical protein
MTVAEILKQAQSLSPQDRKELVKLLVDSLETIPSTSMEEIPRVQLKTGVEIAAMLDEMEPIEFVDPEILDPVEWVKAQRRKEVDRLKSYWEE